MKASILAGIIGGSSPVALLWLGAEKVKHPDYAYLYILLTIGICTFLIFVARDWIDSQRK